MPTINAPLALRFVVGVHLAIGSAYVLSRQLSLIKDQKRTMQRAIKDYVVHATMYNDRLLASQDRVIIITSNAFVLFAFPTDLHQKTHYRTLHMAPIDLFTTDQ